MESEEEEKTTSGVGRRREESSAGEAEAGPRRCFSTGVKSPPPAPPGWSPEHQRWRPALHPAAAATHLVPDIVVEHVSSSTFSDTGTWLRQPSSCGSLSPVDVPSEAGAAAAAGRPLRALSDSSVYPLERCRHSTVSALPPGTRRRATDPPRSSMSLDLFASPSAVGDDPGPAELEMEVFGSEESSGSRAGVQPPSFTSVGWPVGGLGWQPSLQSLGPERSPKASWLRRHSDSNLTSGHGWQTGLRTEPYPIRSHSTGDTLLSAASSREQSSESAAQPPPPPREPAPDGERQRATIPSHLWSTAGRSWQQRASPAARKFFSEGSRQPVAHAEALQPYARSRSENIPSREFLFPTEKTTSVERRVEEVATVSELGAERTKVVDAPTRGALGGKTDGLVEKRLKLKKYLQTRYQMSQDRLHQSSGDVDDVFTERVSNPDRSAAAASEPKDLSTRPRTIAADDGERTAESDSGSSRYFSASSRLQDPSDPRPFHPAAVGRFPLSADDLPLSSVKREPTSPGIVPSGTSVFVFPPPSVPSHPLDSVAADWYHHHHQHHSAASPLASPLSETYQSTGVGGHFPRFFRRPSFPPDEGPYRASGGLRMAQHDVSAIRHRLACSLDISTEPAAAPAPLVAGADTAASGSARLSLAESVRQRLRSGGLRWHRHHHHHHLGDSGSQSSVDDPSTSSSSFSCPACPAAFSSYRHLADHMTDHVTSPPDAGEAPGAESASGKAVHLCPICQRSFSRGDMLTRHVRLHTGIRPYECSLCSQVSRTSLHAAAGSHSSPTRNTHTHTRLTALFPGLSR